MSKPDFDGTAATGRGSRTMPHCPARLGLLALLVIIPGGCRRAGEMPETPPAESPAPLMPEPAPRPPPLRPAPP